MADRPRRAAAHEQRRVSVVARPRPARPHAAVGRVAAATGREGVSGGDGPVDRLSQVARARAAVPDRDAHRRIRRPGRLHRAACRREG